MEQFRIVPIYFFQCLGFDLSLTNASITLFIFFLGSVIFMFFTQNVVFYFAKLYLGFKNKPIKRKVAYYGKLSTIRSNCLSTKRTFCTFNPHIKLPKKVIAFIESKLFQVGLLALFIGGYYFYVFKLTVVIPALVFHAYFIFLTVLFYYCPFKSVSFTFFEILKPYIIGLYFCSLAIVFFYFELWLRLTFLLFVALFFCYLKITNISKEIFLAKVLPKKISAYLSSRSNSDLSLENHFVENIPLVKSIRTATFVFAITTYLFCQLYTSKVFFGTSPIIFVYLVDTIVLLYIYIYIFTLYLIWCTNTPDGFPWVKSVQGFGVAVLGFLGSEYNRSLYKETVEASNIPSMAKYLSQDHRQTSYIIVTRVDAELDVLVNRFRTRFPGILFAYDPNFPYRLDYGSYIAADKAFLDGKSPEEVKSILFRNSERAAKSHYHSIPRTELLLMPVPERLDLFHTEEELAKEAILKKPLNFTDVVCNPHFVNFNGNMTKYTKLNIHSELQLEILKLLEKNKKL